MICTTLVCGSCVIDTHPIDSPCVLSITNNSPWCQSMRRATKACTEPPKPPPRNWRQVPQTPIDLRIANSACTGGTCPSFVAFGLPNDTRTMGPPTSEPYVARHEVRVLDAMSKVPPLSWANPCGIRSKTC